MNISCDKWGSQKSWRIVEARLHASRLPWHHLVSGDRGKCVENVRPKKSQSLLSCLKLLMVCADDKCTHDQLLRCTEIYIELIRKHSDSQKKKTKSGFFSAPFDSHILCHARCGLLIIPFWFREQRWFVSGAWWRNCLKFVFQASFERQIHSDSLKLAAALTIRQRAFMDRAFNLGKRAGLCLSDTFYGPL